MSEFFESTIDDSDIDLFACYDDEDDAEFDENDWADYDAYLQELEREDYERSYDDYYQDYDDEYDDYN